MATPIPTSGVSCDVAEADDVVDTAAAGAGTDVATGAAEATGATGFGAGFATAAEPVTSLSSFSGKMMSDLEQPSVAVHCSPRKPTSTSAIPLSGTWMEAV